MEIYGFETSTVKEPLPEMRCTFNVSARSPQISKRTFVLLRATSVPRL